MLAGFGAFGGIFLAATTGKLVVGGAHPGTIAAAIGVVPCVVGAVGLGRWLAREGGRSSDSFGRIHAGANTDQTRLL